MEKGMKEGRKEGMEEWRNGERMEGKHAESNGGTEGMMERRKDGRNDGRGDRRHGGREQEQITGLKIRARLLVRAGLVRTSLVMFQKRIKIKQYNVDMRSHFVFSIYYGRFQ